MGNMKLFQEDGSGFLVHWIPLFCPSGGDWIKPQLGGKWKLEKKPISSFFKNYTFFLNNFRFLTRDGGIERSVVGMW